MYVKDTVFNEFICFCKHKNDIDIEFGNSELNIKDSENKNLLIQNSETITITGVRTINWKRCILFCMVAIFLISIFLVVIWLR